MRQVVSCACVLLDRAAPSLDRAQFRVEPGPSPRLDLLILHITERTSLDQITRPRLPLLGLEAVQRARTTQRHSGHLRATIGSGSPAPRHADAHNASVTATSGLMSTPP